MSKPELKISIFSDYICPFCYIGHHRVQQLKQDYELKINWCLTEIHPETPSQGMPTTDLDYNDAQWQGIVASLNSLLEKDQLPFKHEHQFTTNSHNALLLAEACKPLGSEIFYRLHNRLFEAFFVDLLNIGDESVLRQIANECEIPAETVNTVFDKNTESNKELERHLQLYLQYAGQAQITGVPTVIIGTQSIPGVPGLSSLQQAAAEAIIETSDSNPKTTI